MEHAPLLPRRLRFLGGFFLTLTLVLPLSACFPPSPPSAPTPPLRGVTIESIDKIEKTAAALEAFSFRPTVRLVLDAESSVEDYAQAIDLLAPRADLLVTLLDSSQMAEVDVAGVAARAEAFVSAYGDEVALWEVGNEINGEWVGSSREEINAKVLAAARVVEAHGGRTALTFNHWIRPDCMTFPREETLSHARSLPAEVLTSVDLVMLSVYETACEPPGRADPIALANELTALGELAPNASLAIGEIGAQGVEDGLEREPTLEEKQALLARMTSMEEALEERVGPRFVGGWFWWYFVRDAVPQQEPASLWPTLEETLADL